MNEPDVHSVEQAVEAFLAHKRGIGRKFVSEEHELSLLVAFADGHAIARLAELTPTLVEEFLASRPRSTPRSFNHLLSALAGLFDWAVSHELLERSPLRVARRRATSRRVPFLFGIDEARRLLDVAGALSDNPRARGRGPTYRSIFALSYGLGLRAGEVCGLRLGDVDVDSQLLVVRGGKFGKSRLVPHGPRVAALVGEQVARRRAAGAGASDAPLFSFDGTRPVHPGTASQTFHHLVPVLGLGSAVGLVDISFAGVIPREGCTPCQRDFLQSSSGTSQTSLDEVIFRSPRSLETSTSRRSQSGAGCARPTSMTGSKAA